MCFVTQMCLVREKDAFFSFLLSVSQDILIVDCKRWNQGKPPEKPKEMALVYTASMPSQFSSLHTDLYCPFITNGSVSLSKELGDLKPITILRATGSIFHLGKCTRIS